MSIKLLVYEESSSSYIFKVNNIGRKNFKRLYIVKKMDVAMKFYVLFYMTIIFINKSDAGFDDDMQALENDLKLEDMKRSQKKSVKDMSTEELIEELKKDINNGKKEKKSHQARFNDIIQQTSNDDFEKLLLANTFKADAKKTKLQTKSANTLQKKDTITKKHFHDASQKKDNILKKQSQDASQKKSADTIKDKTTKKDERKAVEIPLLKRAVATIQELKKANVHDLTAQKKGLELLQQLMKAEQHTPRKRSSISIMDDISIANDEVQQKETARFVKAMNADTANLKKIEEGQKKSTKKEEEETKNETIKKALEKSQNEVDKNEVEVKETKGTLMDEVLKLMAEDLVKEIADEVASNIKRSMEEDDLQKKSGTYGKCVDTRTDCHRLLDFCEDYREKLQNSCAKSCRFCEPCQDNWVGKLAHRCKIIVNQGMCPKKDVEKYCRKSCGYCKIPAPPKCSKTIYGCCWDKTTTKTDSSGNNCLPCNNQYKYVCHRFRMECSSTTKAGSFMRHHCPETCDLCSYTCRDDPKKAFYCPFWKKDLKWCETRKEVMKHFCPVTCGVC